MSRVIPALNGQGEVIQVRIGLRPGPRPDPATSWPHSDWLDPDERADEPCCEICGEPAGSEAIAEVVDTTSGQHLLVHAEPCSYEHGDRYRLA